MVDKSGKLEAEGLSMACGGREKNILAGEKGRDDWGLLGAQTEGAEVLLEGGVVVGRGGDVGRGGHDVGGKGIENREIWEWIGGWEGGQMRKFRERKDVAVGDGNGIDFVKIGGKMIDKGTTCSVVIGS